MPGPAAGAKPEKTMSSRLLTMKFMQRAAAGKKDSPGVSAEESRSPTPKRPKHAGRDQQQSPAAPRSSDLEAISAAIAAEEDKRREAIARQAAEAGETEWVLDFPETAESSYQRAQSPLVIAADSLDAEDEDTMLGGRKCFGNYQRKSKKTQDGGEADEEGEEDGDADLADPSNVEAMIRRAKAQAAQKNQTKKPHREVKLSNLTSISGGRQALIGSSKSQKKRKNR
ncbi:hypothetical protein ASPZODRAFT_135436 [Penicilliopsis zonata CBS 506.65]|uniref:Uncharacterized protein n=1 Tax=Penicilliopsis zonata CBS 506.65 TaxID=1073090 RepID=A0A1L9SA18_9EURO|nr:hypothetical protein ASPZODRAFT_135436 [Penicilliopsis zonata CBS 506.65]OJJ44004.1 hypothetical protein ASPZODRAFT_135436 [Penicilliopsis zonata CBS 506.65]